MNKKHINYFDLGLWKFPHEIDFMLNKVFPQLDNIDYSIYGIEANTEFANKIKLMYKNNENIKIFNLAISNKKGVEKLYLEPSGLGSSIFPTKRNVNVNNYIEIKSNTFSGWIKENNINLNNSINILKENIEGAELYLWEDFKNSGLRDYFQIFCGERCDLYKISELNDKIDYYFNLLKEMNIIVSRFSIEYPSNDNIDMISAIKKFL
jgi:FkbM family methyltransferase